METRYSYTGVSQALALRGYLIGDWPAGLRLTRTSAGIGSMFSKTRGAFTMRSHPAAAHPHLPGMLHVHRLQSAWEACRTTGLTTTLTFALQGLAHMAFQKEAQEALRPTLQQTCAVLAGRDADAEAGLQQPALVGLAGQVPGDARLLSLTTL